MTRSGRLRTLNNYQTPSRFPRRQNFTPSSSKHMELYNVCTNTIHRLLVHGNDNTGNETMEEEEEEEEEEEKEDEYV